MRGRRATTVAMQRGLHAVFIAAEWQPGHVVKNVRYNDKCRHTDNRRFQPTYGVPFHALHTLDAARSEKRCGVLLSEPKRFLEGSTSRSHALVSGQFSSAAAGFACGGTAATRCRFVVPGWYCSNLPERAPADENGASAELSEQGRLPSRKLPFNTGCAACAKDPNLGRTGSAPCAHSRSQRVQVHPPP